MTEPSRVLAVVGTRPNFMKIAPILAQLERHPDAFDTVLVHTGQHYDYEMSQIFVEDLDVPRPDHFLDVGSGSNTQQTARVMERLEPVLLEEAPELVLVPGDVNSTLGAALSASRSGVPVGHVEAGLRSFDRSMPEEINRQLTDQVSELLFTHSPEAGDNLGREGCEPTKIHYVGNTMIDTLVQMRERIDAADAASAQGLRAGEYIVVTLHRPALVDGPLLEEALGRLAEISPELTVVFPAHPRTAAAIEARGLELAGADVRLLPPLGYVEFLSLVASAAGVLTDSGGIQEETTFLGIPCFTLRDNTERPITVEMGTNVLLGLAPERIAELPGLIEEVAGRPRRQPPLWDGQAADRLVDVLLGLDLPRQSLVDSHLVPQKQAG
jgi:UDP-N-acetylglucosamine 2-epimerase (non-hydrolysing)